MRNIGAIVTMFVLANMIIAEGIYRPAPSYDREKVIVNIYRKSTSPPSRDRSADQHIIDVYFCAFTREIEIELYNVGETTISLVNSAGQIVDSVTISTDSFVPVCLCVPNSGSFLLIIDSVDYYAYSTIMIR